MSTQLYIPKRIKVGFQKRDDTYTGKLAYIIYYDDKGVLRKETSWKGWRDTKIAAEEYDNVPTTGLVLNKDVKRYNSWSDFGGKRTMIRVWDPRGIEIEITTHNLIGVLMHSDCIKRQLMGDYVYAWDGPELVLLPTCSEEYQKATAYTALQAGKIDAKELVPGCGYRTKKEVDLIYVGRYDWHALDSYRSGVRKTKRYHIFMRPGVKDEYEDKWHYELKSSVEFLAAKTTEQLVEEFASMVESFQCNIHSARIVKWEAVPAEVSTSTTKQDHWNGPPLKRSTYHKLEGNTLTEYTVSAEYKTEYGGDKRTHTFLGYGIIDSYWFNIETQSIIQSPKQDYYNWSDRNCWSSATPLLTAEQLQAYGLCDLWVTLDNGKRVRLKSIQEI